MPRVNSRLNQKDYSIEMRELTLLRTRKWWALHKERVNLYRKEIGRLNKIRKATREAA